MQEVVVSACESALCLEVLCIHGDAENAYQ